MKKKKNYKWRLFLTELGLALTEPECLRRVRVAPGRVGERAGAAVPVRTAKRKQCGFCEKPLRTSNFFVLVFKFAINVVPSKL